MTSRGWVAGIVLWLATMPATGTYQLNSYGFGTGGTANSGTANYAINGIAGEAAGDTSSTTYQLGAGETRTKQANVPLVSLANGVRWYNKLLVTIDTQNNPSDATFAIAISSDGFTTTQYVKSDFTVGSSLTTADYLTYAGWGSGSGQLVRGLQPGTVYSVKAKAYRGSFTESPYGPVVTASTVNPQLAFDIDVSATDQSTNPPYQIDFGSLTPGTITDSPKYGWVSYDTNAESGGGVYISGQYGGLRSAHAAYTIASLTGDLSGFNEGSGLQGATATQASGGPLTLVSPYAGSGQNVGIVDGTIRLLYRVGAPIISGRGSFLLKAKSQVSTPSADDYTEVLTAIAAASF